MTDLIDVAGPLAAGASSPDVERWADRTTTLIAEQVLRLALYRGELPGVSAEDYVHILQRALAALPSYKVIHVTTDLWEALSELPPHVQELLDAKVRPIAS